MRPMVAVVLLLLTPAAAMAAGAKSSSGAGSDVDPAFEADCTARGGIVTFGIAGPACAMPEPDAGAACTGSAECSGFCLAETRTCSPVTPYFGCFRLYEKGQADVSVCID